MQRDAIFTASLVLALGHASGCSVLFDPAQYSSEDADRLDARATVDAPDPGDLDAFVPPGADADLDAFRAPDAVPPDAAIDAFTPADAGPPRCPGTTSLELPGCLVRGNGLAYCDPASGATRVLSSETAMEMLPGLRHELGLLGNGNQVAEAAADGIVDIELAREGERVVAVWLDAATHDVHRREYVVGSSGLTAGAVETASYGAIGSVGTDLSVRPGHVEDIAVGYLDARGDAAYGDCRAPAFPDACAPAASQTTGIASGGRVLVGHADDVVVGLFPGRQTAGGPDGFFLEQVRPAPGNTTFFGAALTFEGLRSTTGSFTYSQGASDLSERVVSGVTFSPRHVGERLPRLVRNDAELNDYRLMRAYLAAGGNIQIDGAFVSEVGGGLDCGGGSCTELGVGAAERFVTNTFPELVDWTYDIVDHVYRVAAFLVGDADGTEVAIAMWDVAMGLSGDTLTPLVVGSGRVVPSGRGRAIRTVVARDASSLEVFVLALVTQGEGPAARDRLFLSGFRLRACGGG